MKQTIQDLTLPDAAEAPLTPAELRQLRGLLRVAWVDPSGGALRLTVGDARITLRRDGTVRLDGVNIVQTAGERILLDGGAIELN